MRYDLLVISHLVGDVNNIELYSITLSHYIYMALNAVYEAVFTGVFLFRTLLVSAKSRYREILLNHENVYLASGLIYCSKNGKKGQRRARKQV